MRPGKYNDLATAFLASPDETIKHIFSLGRLSRRYEVCAGSNWCGRALHMPLLLAPVYRGA